jgi:hypothetical protein
LFPTINSPPGCNAVTTAKLRPASFNLNKYLRASDASPPRHCRCRSLGAKKRDRTFRGRRVVLSALLRLFRPAHPQILILDGEPVAATWGWRLRQVEHALGRGSSGPIDNIAPEPFFVGAER